MADIDSKIEKKKKKVSSLKKQIETANSQLKALTMEIDSLEYERLKQIASTEATDLETLVRALKQNQQFKSRGLSDDEIDELADGDKKKNPYAE